MDGLAETSAPVPRGEQWLIVTQLALHLADVACHCALTLWVYSEPALPTWLFALMVIIIVWANLVSSCYIAFARAHGWDQVLTFVLNCANLQVVREARKAVKVQGDSDYFHTLRLLEAILQSAPMSFLAVYFLLLADAGELVDITPSSVNLMLGVMVLSAMSVATGLGLWEYRVGRVAQSSSYCIGLVTFRFLEISSRALTLALFAVTLRPNGFWIAVGVDYLCMLFLVARHGAVQFAYGVFVAMPLVFVSLEPLVWKREDHAVPKDTYYPVRVVEFVLMWYCIAFEFGMEMPASVVTRYCEFVTLGVTFLLYVMLPFIWRRARQFEVQREEDGGSSEEWLQEDWKEPFAAHLRHSDSESSGDSDSRGAE